MSRLRGGDVLPVLPWLALCLTGLGTVAAVALLTDASPKSILVYGHCSDFQATADCGTQLLEFRALSALGVGGCLSGFVLGLVALALAGRIAAGRLT